MDYFELYQLPNSLKPNNNVSHSNKNGLKILK